MPTAVPYGRAFYEAYRTELRAEAPERGRVLYEAFAERYDAITPILFGRAAALPGGRGGGGTEVAAAAGRQNLSVLRLMKSAFTFEDGATYLAWKIKRHSGVSFELTPWQKRHQLASGNAVLANHRAGGRYALLKRERQAPLPPSRRH